MKFFVNENCIGCGLCTSLCPEIFSMSENDTAQAADTDVTGAENDTANEALHSCPVDAIEEKK